MKPTTLFLAGLCAAGLFAGHAARRLSAGNPEPLATDAALADHPAREAATPAAAAGVSSGKPSAKTAPPPAAARSTDTVESALALDPEKNYGRIALWMATAGEQDLQAYWAGYKDGKRTVDVTDLVFINWTRRNPQAAVAAVDGTDDERYAWWSWASNDPKAALAAAKASGKHVALEQAACGIGDFNPEWLRKNLDAIPEEFRGDAFGRMRNWPDRQDPLESLTFMRKHGQDFDGETFKSLARKDPWAAIDWMKENPLATRNPYGNNELTELLVSTLEKDRPEDLEQLAEQTPAGELKRKLEEAAFAKLLETDPDAALDKARKMDASRVSAQLLGKAGLGLMASDPEKAFGIAGEILAANPEGFGIEQWIEYPGGQRGYRSGEDAGNLMNALFNKDRERTLLMMADHAGEKPVSDTLYEYSGKWAKEDLAGFSEWANRQTGKIHQVAAQQIGNTLAMQGNYEEAIEWAAHGALEPDRSYNAVLYYWNRSDPDAAAEWIEQSNLTEGQKDNYRKYLKNITR